MPRIGRRAKSPGRHLLFTEGFVRGGVFGLDDRTLEQIACVKRFKFERGITGEQDGWKNAMKVWLTEKIDGMTYAERFAQVYKPGKKVDEIYAEMFLRDSIVR
jgi:hypothetical protein